MVYPELAFIEFKVMSGDYSKTDDHLGSFVASFVSIKSGYRHVHLENYSGIKLTPASLFIHVSVTVRNQKSLAENKFVKVSN